MSQIQLNEIRKFNSQNVALERIEKPFWNQNNVRDLYQEKAPTLNGRILSIFMTYGGGEEHPFKAYLLDSKSQGRKSFDLVIVDQNTTDRREAIMRSWLHIDLGDLAEKDITLNVHQLFSR